MVEEQVRAARYTLGLGCERGCDPAELRGLAESVLGAGGIKPGDLAGIFSLDARAGEPAMVALAALWQLPFICFDAVTLEKETPRLAHPSRRVFELTGSHGVAEAAALAAAGPDSELVVGKTKSAHATAALARKR